MVDSILSPASPVPAKRSGGCLKSCLVVSVILFVLAAGGLYFAAVKIQSVFKEKGAEVVEQITAELLKDAALPAADKAQIDAVMKRFSGRIRSGEISPTEVVEIGQRLSQSPLVPALAAQAFSTVVLQSTNLPRAEQEEGRKIANRFARGVSEGKISKDTAVEIFRPWKEKLEAQNGEQFNPEQVRGTVAQMKKAADQAAMPQTDFKVDIPAELQRLLEGKGGK